MRPECERYLPLIVRSADGPLASEPRAELDAHLASCAECREAVEAQASVGRVLREVEFTPGPRDFAARVRARVAPGPGLLDLFNWRAWTLRLAPVAALLALLAWYPGSTSTAVSSQTQTLPAALDAWAGGQAQVAGGLLVNSNADRDALLAAALGETSR